MNAIENEISQNRKLEISIKNEIEKEKNNFALYLKNIGIQHNENIKQKKSIKDKIKEIINIIKQ